MKSQPIWDASGDWLLWVVRRIRETRYPYKLLIIFRLAPNTKAPRAGLESYRSVGPVPPSAGWLIPPSAELYQLSMGIQKPFYASLFYFSLLNHCLWSRRKFLSPHQNPWARESFRSLRCFIIGIVMLMDAAFQIIRRPAIISSVSFAFKNVSPERHLRRDANTNGFW